MGVSLFLWTTLNSSSTVLLSYIHKSSPRISYPMDRRLACKSQLLPTFQKFSSCVNFPSSCSSLLNSVLEVLLSPAPGVRSRDDSYLFLCLHWTTYCLDSFSLLQNIYFKVLEVYFHQVLQGHVLDFLSVLFTDTFPSSYFSYISF